MSVLLRRKRSEEMIQLNASSTQGSKVPLKSLKGWWLLKSPRLYRFLEEGRTEKENELLRLFVKGEQIGVA